MEEPQIGSITGGGRYDKLISQLGGPDISATGTSMGLDRICEVISELNLLKQEGRESSSILITVFKESLLKESLSVFSLLRKSGISCEIYSDPEASLKKQLEYADKKRIPFVLIMGPEEIKKNTVIVKNMATREQFAFNRAQIFDWSEQLLRSQ